MKLKYFNLNKQEIEIAGLSISKWAEKIGRTPFYIYDRQIILKKIAEVRSTLPEGVQLHYAIKANPMPELVKFLAAHVDGFDIASDGELQLAMDSGMDPECVGFAGPGKTNLELEEALNSGILISVESKNEILRIAELAQSKHLKPRIALRINPGFEMKGSGMKMGGGPKQFGIDSEDLKEACDILYSSKLSLEGIHVYAGSQMLNADTLCETQKKCFEYLYSIKGLLRNPLKSFNFGGGFGVPYFLGEGDLDLEKVKTNLHQLMLKFEQQFPKAKAIMELGRYLVAESGLFVSRIVDKKISRGSTFLVLDGGMNAHLAATGNLGQVIKRSFPMCIGNNLSAKNIEVVNVVGPLCTPLDSFGQGVKLNESKVGDLLVIFQSGAYGLSSSPIHFLSHRVPQEVLA